MGTRGTGEDRGRKVTLFFCQTGGGREAEGYKV